MASEMLIILSFAIIGACFGSFVSLVSYRLPRQGKIVFTRSECPSCHRALGVAALVPIFSWAIQKGQCRYCGAKVSARYPMIEIGMAAIFAWLAARYGLSAQSFLLMLFATALAILIVTDLEHFIIPDSVNLALLVLAICYHTVMQTYWLEPVIGGCIGLALALGLRIGYRVLRKKEGLGMGDVKLFAVTGVWLGTLHLAPFIFLSGLLGILSGMIWRVCGKGKIFPFGPAMAVSLFICVAVPEVPRLFWQAAQFYE